jgi:signal transduction histidine kinase
MTVFGQRLRDVIRIWDANTQARDSERLVRLQRDFLDLSKARGKVHKNLGTVQMMLHALADGAFERYYPLLLDMVLQVYRSGVWEEANSRLPRIIRVRLAFILRALD